jgi:uncharacterized membrane protein
MSTGLAPLPRRLAALRPLEKVVLYALLPACIPAFAFVASVVTVSTARIQRNYGESGPAVLRVHGATLSIAALCAVIQLLRPLAPRLHRISGYLYLVMLNVGISIGDYLQVQPILRGTAGLLNIVSSGGFVAWGAYLQITAFIGLHALLVRRDVAAHRRFMTCSTLGTLAGLLAYRLAAVITLLLLGRTDLTGPFGHEEIIPQLNAAQKSNIAGAVTCVACTLAVDLVLRLRARRSS